MIWNPYSSTEGNLRQEMIKTFEGAFQKFQRVKQLLLEK